jgi:hypothetical protein
MEERFNVFFTDGEMTGPTTCDISTHGVTIIAPYRPPKVDEDRWWRLPADKSIKYFVPWHRIHAIVTANGSKK